MYTQSYNKKHHTEGPLNQTSVDKCNRISKKKQIQQRHLDNPRFNIKNIFEAV